MPPPQATPPSPWEWTAEDVQCFLAHIGLAELQPLFWDHEVTGLVLLSMSEEDLKESLGIWKFGPRRKLSLELQEFRRWYRSVAANSPTGGPRLQPGSPDCGFGRESSPNTWGQHRSGYGTPPEPKKYSFGHRDASPSGPARLDVRRRIAEV